MAVDKPMAKIGFISFLVAAWIVIIELEMGWLTLIVLAPMTGLVMLILSAAVTIAESLLRWINK
jgi:hypothetical protein